MDYFKETMYSGRVSADVINTYFTHIAASRLTYTGWPKKVSHFQIIKNSY